MRALAEKGHDVTIISPFSENNLPKGGSYREILLPEMLAQLESKLINKLFEVNLITIFSTTQ